MDHLLVPKDPVRSPPRIRYYCFEEYDRGDFITYPERQGWTQEKLFTRTTWTEVDSVGGRGAAAAAAFLQQWLFFGLLHEAFGPDVNFQDYIDEANGMKYIHTRNLLSHADDLVEKRNAGLVSETDVFPLDDSLYAAYSAFDFICQEPVDALDPYFLLSLSLLARFLLCLRQVLFRDNDLMSRGNRAVWDPPRVYVDVPGHETHTLQSDSGDHMSILAYEMVKEGWCARAVNSSQKAD
ncbi:hypothetical protein SLS58_010561 [Diplodia intermedia]|uniref:Uncharacterized protein n=1 Tax=Diplodia intermedia TaxID=856260 RepID=A0ABR3T5E9_9PEZI